MDASQVSKLLALIDTNELLRELANASTDDSRLWQFFCECGRPDCRGLVALTLAEYESMKDDQEAILASGHMVDQKERAQVLREHAQALRAQAQLQIERAKRNTGRHRP